jgi:two-component system, OmpR family, sensor histidine kinase ChvG
LILRLKDWLKAHWPRLRLRTILLGSFIFVAGLPGLSAIFLRVYENTLIRQTESEMIAQGVALAAAAGNRFADGAQDWQADNYFRPEPPGIDLNKGPYLPERPAPRPTALRSDEAALSLARAMEPVIVQTGRTTLASIILLDRQGTILTGNWTGLSLSHVPEVQAALAGKTQTVLRRNGNYQARYAFEWLSRAAALRVHHARPIIVEGKVQGVLLLSRSSRALFLGMYQDRGKIAVGVLVILSILLLMTLLLHRTIGKPIEALSKVTRDVAQGHGEVPETPATAATEIRALYEDFRSMAEVITRRSRYLKDFAAAVSHEFKTPLAGIRGSIELIEDHGDTMSAADQARFLGNIRSDADRLSSLVSRLMDLARADMARPEQGSATLIGPVLQTVADALRSDGFAVSLDFPEGLPTVAIPAQTLETIAMTLVENARQAGASQVAITARLGEAATVQLDFTNDGPAISSGDAARMFEPFYTTKRASGGTGLGLSIARSLVEANLGTLELAPTDQGACFCLMMRAVA